MRIQLATLFTFIITTIVSGQTIKSYKSAITGDTIKFKVYFPENYSNKKKYPLLVFLHGMNEKTWPVGNFNPKVTTVGLPALLEKGLKLPFITIVPNIAYADWDNIGYSKNNEIKFKSPGMLADEIARMAQSRFLTDTSRTYITGISMGGGGTLSAIQNYPHSFSAALAIAGWGDPSKACQTLTPVWIFQGEKDNGHGMENLAKAIQSCRPDKNTRYTILAGKGHAIWDEVYENKVSEGTNIYNWLLSFKK